MHPFAETSADQPGHQLDQSGNRGKEDAQNKDKENNIHRLRAVGNEELYMPGQNVKQRLRKRETEQYKDVQSI
jgi:hypothetical protein